ncbi:hypothetical protein QQY66_20370 [Streptomyces sp. DG2A-72]|uniref:hypothetical protein n=1 Tax=Streptomyces sp. DG2A-72 TaxID=3051386 RepID=UPI00265B7602|nr:hypothetical protein [Streptomyces sp. DG2A-72]MDO0933923.1 hypothetical protein [Streptomyces sp. DG2A-72]
MRTHLTRTIALVLFAVVGCGSEAAGGHSPAPETKERAGRVAEAWDGSAAAEAYGRGYYPMQGPVQPPEGGWHDADDKEAYATQNFALSAELPKTHKGGKSGKVKWQSGETLTLDLTGALEAYETLARNSGDGPRLTVTRAELGETTMATSRGPATVPAWLFTLEGYDTPLKRVAIGPSKIPQPPIGPAAEGLSGDLWDLGGVVEVAGDGRSVTVVAHHGACDDGPAVDVLETDGSVVLSGYVVGTDDGLCQDSLHAQERTVELDRPVGDRVLLDAFTGRPLGPARD